MTLESKLPNKQPDVSDAEDDLHQALRHALTPPPLPVGFRTQLLARVQSEQLADLQRHRQQLDQEYQRERQRLQADYRRLRRDRLGLIVASAFAAGVCMSLLLPWIYSLVGSQDSVSVALVVAVMTLALGTGVCLERFGKPGLPGFGP